MSLSARFAKIGAGKGRKATPNQQTMKTQKAKVVVAQQKGKRNQAVALKRGTATPSKVAPGKSSTRAMGGNVEGKGKGVKKGTPGKGKVGAKRDGKKKTEKPSQADLDMEMGAYWHKAGKGPDPKLAALDKEMDDYRAASAKKAE